MLHYNEVEMLRPYTPKYTETSNTKYLLICLLYSSYFLFDPLPQQIFSLIFHFFVSLSTSTMKRTWEGRFTKYNAARSAYWREKGESDELGPA